MLIIVKDSKGQLTPIGAFLASVQLPALPDSFNVDDGVVEKGRQLAMQDHPQLDNTSWQNLGILLATRQFLADRAATTVQPVKPGDPIADAMHEALHGTPRPQFVDASDPAAAKAERDADALAAAEKLNQELLKVVEEKKAELEALKAKAAGQAAPAPDEPENSGSPADGKPTAADLEKADEEARVKAATSGAATSGSDKIQ